MNLAGGTLDGVSSNHTKHTQSETDRDREEQTGGGKEGTDLSQPHIREMSAVSQGSFFKERKPLASCFPVPCSREWRQWSKSRGRALFSPPSPGGAFRWLSRGSLQAAPYKNAFRSPGKSQRLQLMITSIYDTHTMGLLDNAPVPTGAKTMAVFIVGRR